AQREPPSRTAECSSHPATQSVPAQQEETFCFPSASTKPAQGFPPRRGERRIARGERAKASHPWSTLFATPGAPAGAPGAGLNSPGGARCALNPWLFSVRPSGAENLAELPLGC